MLVKEGRHPGPSVGHVGDPDKVGILKPGVDENINYPRSPSTGSTHRLSDIDKKHSIDHTPTYPTTCLPSCFPKPDT